MIVLVAKYHVKPGHMDEVIEHLKEMAPQVKANEPGCMVYTASRSRDDDNLLMLVEHYTDEAALSQHRDMPHFKQIIEGKVVPLLEKRERELYDLAIG
ncbi:MAG: putative quinol monooxygenase [Pseudomonadota bacterium]